MPKRDVTTWYLELEGATPPPPSWPEGVQLVESVVPDALWSQFLFCAVGRPWGWHSRLGWDFDQWDAWVNSGRARTWVLWDRGTPVGYLELVRHGADSAETSWRDSPEASVEVKFLGLLPGFIGRGLGSGLVAAAVRQAREWAPGPVWLHTCDADHPAALRLYEHAGFAVRRETHSVEDLPDADDPRQLCAPFVGSSITVAQAAFRGRAVEPERERLPGPPAVLVCGYESPERETLQLFLGLVFVDPPALRPVSAASPERTVAELLAAPEEPEAPGCGQLPRVVLLSGCTLVEVRGVMDQWKASGLARPIFAVATENNLGFRVRDLVAHLLEEERAARN
jgi:GNAT superfamily N-acetyltransferase